MRNLITEAILVCFVISFGACRRNVSNTNKSSNTNANRAVSANSKGQTKSADAQALFDEGERLFDADNDKQAIQAYERALAVDPNFADAHFKLALSFAAVDRIEESREEFKKAIDEYKKIVAANPSDADAYYKMGRCYGRLNLHESAASSYRQAAKINKDDATVYYELGVTYIKLAQYKEAITALNRSLEIDPDNFRAADALEEAKAGQARFDATVKHQEDMLKKEKEKAANTNMGASTPH